MFVSCDGGDLFVSFLWLLLKIAFNHQFSASAVELEFLRSERRLRSGRHFA
jgi:hypothetical protein